MLSGLGLLFSGCGGYGGGSYSYGPISPQALVRGSLSGAAETTVVAPDATGESLFDVRSDGTLTFAVTGEAAWVGSVTSVALHRGSPGGNGPVELDLLSGGATFDPVTRTATGTLSIGTSLAGEMISYPSYFYVNVSTAAAPAGFVRAQLAPATAMQLHATLRAAEETSASDPSARGAVTLAIGTDRVVHYVVATGSPSVSQLTLGRVHAGALGADGPVVLDLGLGTATANLSESTLTGSVIAPVDVLCRMTQSPAGFYADVRTAAFPSGLARGQLSTAPVTLWAALSGLAEVVVVDASARGGLSLELTSFTTGRAIYAAPVTQGIGAVDGAHVHAGFQLANGPSVIDLRAGSDFVAGADSAEGAITLDQTLYARLLAAPGAFYADFHTPTAPSGLVRGQLSADPATFRASMLGTLQTTVVDPSATGTMQLVVTSPHAASFDVAMSSPAATTLVGAHAHEGPAGVDGPIVIDLIGGTDLHVTAAHLTGKVALAGPIFARLLAAPARFYGNVHTVPAPNGVARNQFVQVPSSSAPSGLTYTSPVTYVVGSAITPNLPASVGGAVASYSVAPALPAGLALDTTNGSITGTPLATSAATDYTVTATNGAGGATAVVNIQVDVAAPANLAYTTPVTYVVGTAIGASPPTSSGGAISSYSVLPALPGGLSLHATTGVISGTPTVAAAVADYVVTGSNVTGSTTATVRITVQSSLTAPTGLSYATPVSYPTGAAITSNTPTVGGGPVATWSVAPALPAGLTLSTSTGVISGTPTAITGAANYTVTATNGAGFTTAVVNIAVTLGAPTGLSYSNSPGFGYVGTGQFLAMNPSASGGTIASYSVAPALPAGIAIHTGTGVIAGAPTATSSYTGYTVTATNATGSTTFTVYITVLP